jgi:hypothetical protein
VTASAGACRCTEKVRVPGGSCSTLLVCLLGANLLYILRTQDSSVLVLVAAAAVTELLVLAAAASVCAAAAAALCAAAYPCQVLPPWAPLQWW